MRAVIQRVSEASVTIDNTLKAAIGKGFVVLLGIEINDEESDVKLLAKKIVQLRIFGDENSLMNKSILEVDGDLLLISQFTLHAATKKGNRPSFIKAAKPEQAIPLYEAMIAELERLMGKKIAIGVFGADMKVALVNDGPVTIIIDTKNME